MLKKILMFLTLLYAAMAFAAVEVNTATEAELDSVKGIGPAISKRILDERKKSNFKDWADLKARVHGFGDKTSAKFSQAGLTVNGASFGDKKADKEKTASTDDALVKSKGCLACHAVDKKVVGPSYKDVAKKYAGDKKAADALATKIIKGGSGAWGAVPMPPNNVTEAEAKKLVDWVLSQK